jgi:hypothetical protein
LITTTVSAHGMPNCVRSASTSSDRPAVGVLEPVTTAVATAGGNLSAAAADVQSTGNSIADLLQQLPSHPSLGASCGGACIRRMHESAACFGGVGLDGIPASLLLTNYIADVGTGHSSA